MEPCIQNLDDLLSALENASKVTEQRNACKNIQNWLFEEQNKAALSAVPGDSELTWKVLVGEILNTVEDSSKPQKFHIDLLRDCLEGARQFGSSGTFPYADRACTHVCSALQPEVSPYKAEYSAIFGQLIKSRLFRISLTGANLRKILDQSIDQIRRCVDSPEFHDARQDVARRDLMLHLEALSSITRELHRDDQLTAACIENIFITLEHAGIALHNGQAVSDRTLLATRLVECIAELLAHFALDYQELAARLLSSIVDLIGMCWSQGMDLLKIGYVQCLRVALAAGIDLDSHIVGDALNRLRQEISSFRFRDSVADSRHRLSKEAFYIMDLTAEIVMMRLRKRDDVGLDGSDPIQAKGKRPRAELVADWLIDAVFGLAGARPRPSIQWMQFLCFLVSKHPSAFEAIAAEASDASVFCRTVLEKFEAVLNGQLEDSCLVWCTRCLTAIMSCAGSFDQGQFRSAMRPILRVCLELLKGRFKRAEGLIATAALLRAVRISLIRKVVGEEMLVENIDTLWQILIAAWGGPNVAHARGHSVAQTDNEIAQHELMLWTAVVLQRSHLSSARGFGRVECPRDCLLDMVLTRSRVGFESAEQVQRIALVILSLICGSSSTSSDYLMLESSRDVAHAKETSSEGAVLFTESRQLLFGLGLKEDADRYIWLVDDEEDVARFERMIASLHTVTDLSSSEAGADGDNRPSASTTTPESRIFINATDVDRMRGTLQQYLGGIGSFEAGPSQPALGHNDNRIVLLSAIAYLSEDFADAGQALFDDLYSHIRGLLHHDMTATSSVRPSSSHIWGLIDSFDVLGTDSKMQYFSRVGFVVSALSRVVVRGDFQDLMSSFRSFLLEVCRHCVRIWNSDELKATSTKTDDDGFGQKETKSVLNDHTLKLTALRLYLKVLATGHLDDRLKELIEHLSKFLTMDSVDNAHGLKFTVRKLEILSELYMHPHFDEMYLGTLERVMPMKKDDDYKHHRKLIVLHAVRTLATFLKNCTGECDLSLFEAKLIPSGHLLHKFLEANAALISCRPPKQLQRDIRRVLCRTIGQVLTAIKVPNQEYVQYILNCLNDCAFEVRYEAGLACPAFFSTWDSPNPIMSQIVEKFPSIADMSQKCKALILTHIQALAKIGSLPEQYSNEMVEGHCIYLLCEFYHRFPSLRRYITRALSVISTASDLKIPDMVKIHIHSILCKWIRGRRLWREFPFVLTGSASVQAFVQSCVVNTLVPEYILFDQETIDGVVVDAHTSLQQIASCCGVAQSDHLKGQAYPKTLAYVLQLCTPLPAIDEEADQDFMFRDRNWYAKLVDQALNAEQLIPSFFGGYDDLSGRVDDVLLCLLDNLIFGMQCAACRNFEGRDTYIFSVQELETSLLFSIQRLAAKLKIEPRKLLLGYSLTSGRGSSGSNTTRGSSGSNTTKVPQKDRLQRLLLHCLHFLKESKKVNMKLRSLSAVRVLLDQNLLGNIADPPWVFHHVVNLLLQALALEPNVSEAAVLLLHQIINQCLENNSERVLESSVLTRIICALIPLAQKAASYEDNPYMNLIDDLAEACMHSPNLQIESLPPFPHDDIFANAIEKCNRLPPRDSFENLVRSFASSDDHVSAIVKDAYLSHLLDFVHFKGHRLQNIDQQTLRRLFSKLLHLAKQSSSKADTTTNNLLGQCIAHCFADLLPVQSQLMSFTVWNLPVLSDPSRGTTRRGGRPGENLCLASIGNTMVKILKCSVEAEAEYRVTEAASNLLKDLFRHGSPLRADLLSPDTVMDQHLRDFLEPYIADEGTDLRPENQIVESVKRRAIDDPSLWQCGDSYASWVCGLAHALCLHNSEHMVWPKCAHLCSLKSSFAELVFPHLLLEFYLCSRNSGQSQFKALVSNMLESCILAPDNSNIAAVQLVVNALEFLNAFRCEMVKHRGNPFANQVAGWDTCYWFDVSYLTAAKAALRCGAPLTSFLFLERLFSVKGFSSSAQSIRVLNKREEVEDLLMKVYQSIDEPDGNAAFDKGFDLASVAFANERDEEWWRALGVFDVGIMNSQDFNHDSPIDARFFKALNNSGFTFLSSTLASRSDAMGIANTDMSFESLWRAERWGHTVSSAMMRDICKSTTAGGLPGFHHSIYQVLSICSFRSFTDPNLQRHQDHARLAAMLEVATCSFQSTKSLLPSMVKLRMVEDVFAMLSCASISTDSQDFRNQIASQLESWEQWYKSMMYHDFQFLEPALALHMILLSLLGNDSVREHHYCLVAKYSMKCNNLAYARSALHRLQASKACAPDCPNLDAPGWSLWLAKLYWRDGKEDRAASLLNSLQRHLESSETLDDKPLLARVLALNASWWAKSRSRNWKEIEDNFVKSIGMQENPDNRVRLARFMDSLYSAEQVHSDELKKQLKDLEKQEHELKQVTDAKSETDAEVLRSYRQRLKHLEFRKANLIERLHNKRKFLVSALDNYLVSMDSAKKAGHSVFRVLHLWFEGHDDDTGSNFGVSIDSVSESVLDGLKHLGSCKPFLIIIPQIISRLDFDKKATSYQKAAWYLVSRLLQQAPQELLFHMSAAINEKRAPKQIKSANVSFVVNSNKIKAAMEILDEFKNSDSDSALLVQQTTELIEAYIQLADYRSQQQLEMSKEYPLTALLKRIKWSQQQSRVLVPTASGHENDCNPPMVGSFEGWTYPGGITLPKKITCKSTDHRSFVQVVKGGEDPRSDSISSQLFCVINVLLRGNRSCRRRKLEVRTYKVIPLHPQAGLIEWVSDAASLGSLLGTTSDSARYQSSLHGRYNPDGWTHKQCHDLMLAVQNQKSVSPAEKYARSRAAIQEIFANFKPVFRHYFFDRSSTAPDWFQRRLAYTRSVAASSIAGFVVGLGDRHTNNILVLEQTGEVVHIDLGVVFDQGRLLPMPEMIPFRLTRDTVDGMGVAGTGGVFSRCCEETLLVLRENRQALLAVVDVLMHDPLTSWKMSVNKKARRQRGGADGDGDGAGCREGSGSSPSGSKKVLQDEEGGGINVDASFVRNSVREKLEGWDRGELLSVEGQVKKLICDAQSLDNFAQLFRGWAAWM